MRLKLTRQQTQSSYETLEQSVSAVLSKESDAVHAGCALRVHGVLSRRRAGGVSIRRRESWLTLVVSSKSERDDWFAALLHRLAPWKWLRKANFHRNNVSLRFSPKFYPPPEADCAQQSEDKLWPRVRDLLSNGNSLSTWTLNVSKGITAAAEAGENVTHLLQTLSLIAPGLQVLSVLASACSAVSTALRSRPELRSAHARLNEICEELAETLLELDKDEYFSNKKINDEVWFLFESCWERGVEIERHAMSTFVVQVLKSEAVREILKQVQEIEASMLMSGLVKHVSAVSNELRQQVSELESKSVLIDSRLDEHSNRIDRIEIERCENKTTDKYVGVFPRRDELCAQLFVCASPKFEKLKKMLLSPRNDMKPRHVVQVCGESGVGKTSTCKLLVTDAEVQTRYCGSVLWLNMLRDMSEREAVDLLLELLESVGGYRLAEELRKLKSLMLRTVVERISLFLPQKRVLLALDNVWDDVKTMKNWVRAFSPLARGPGSCLLVSTRQMLGCGGSEGS